MRASANDGYRRKAIYSDGSVQYDDLSLENVAQLELVPLEKTLEQISLVIDGDKKPIFFTRRFFRFTDKDTVENYRNIYFIGYSLHNHIYLESVDSLTNERRIEINGDSYILPGF
jgi:hypothetical protein